MNINDPFGRMTRRNEAHYASLRDSLKSSGIDSVAAAEACQQDMFKRIRNTGIVTLLASVILALMLPAYKAPILVVASMLLLWIITTGWRGKKLIQRYIEEELNQP